MGGQMGGGSGGYGADDGMAAWIESRERRIRTLEAENEELRRQLDLLRQGAGITVLIDGHPYALAASTPPASAASPAIPTDTRPAAAPSLRTGARVPVQRPHASQPGDNPYLPRPGASAPPASSYAFEQPWRAPTPPAPQLPAPQPGPSLPSMPTTQMPITAARPIARRPRATDSSWLTDERPTVPGSSPGSGPRIRIPTNSPREEDAWLRSGAAWPQPPQRPAALPELPAPSAHPATPIPPAHVPARPVSAPHPTPRPTPHPMPREQAPAGRNVFADSFIL